MLPMPVSVPSRGASVPGWPNNGPAAAVFFRKELRCRLTKLRIVVK